ncbi:MAG: type VI secretion system tube protein Hcp [Bdellovibrionota bacterium]
MSFFVEIGDAYSHHHDVGKKLSLNLPNLSDLIPIYSMEYGISKSVKKKATETTVSHARTHELVFTKAFDGNSNEILHHAAIRKTKEVRIYVTESASEDSGSSLGGLVSSVADKASSLNIKAVLTFGDAHIRSVHTSGSGATGGVLVETVHVNYSTLMIRNLVGGQASSQGYDFKTGKAL